MLKASDGAKKLIGDFSPKLVELTDRAPLPLPKIRSSPYTVTRHAES